MMHLLLYALLGLSAGGFSGLIGIGGAVIVIPALVYWFGLTQRMAQGTTMAMMLPPIGLLAAWVYYRQGFVDLKIAAMLCVGFLIGSGLSAQFAVGLPDTVLKRIFALTIIGIGLRMLWSK